MEINHSEVMGVWRKVAKVNDVQEDSPQWTVRRKEYKSDEKRQSCFIDMVEDKTNPYRIKHQLDSTDDCDSNI
jgi:hypothetical protein